VPCQITTVILYFFFKCVKVITLSPDDNQTSVRKLGGLGPLVSLLSHSSDGIKDQACAALRALLKGVLHYFLLLLNGSLIIIITGNGKNQNELRNLNCIPALINNLCCDDDRIKEHAAGAILELARNNGKLIAKQS